MCVCVFAFGILQFLIYGIFKRLEFQMNHFYLSPSYYTAVSILSLFSLQGWFFWHSAGSHFLFKFWSKLNFFYAKICIIKDHHDWGMPSFKLLDISLNFIEFVSSCAFVSRYKSALNRKLSFGFFSTGLPIWPNAKIDIRELQRISH